MQNNKGRAKTIRFRNDYDFEEANKAFEDMCLKSDNAKVGEETEQVFYDFFNFILLLSIQISDQRFMSLNYRNFLTINYQICNGSAPHVQCHNLFALYSEQ